jgi:putative DNA primase/helicase
VCDRGHDASPLQRSNVTRVLSPQFGAGSYSCHPAEGSLRSTRCSTATGTSVTSAEGVSPAEVITARLTGRWSGGRGMARCPAHDDTNPSLSLANGRDGRVLVKCQAGCGQGDVIARLRALGIDLGPSPSSIDSGQVDREPRYLWETVRAVHDGAPDPPPAHSQLGTPDCRYEYRDGDGGPIGYVYRWHAVRRGGESTKKEVRPLTLCRDRRTGRYAWRWRQFDTPRPLYGLDRLGARPAAPVLVVGGEKTADAAQTLLPDYAVVTSPGGEAAARLADWSPLIGRRIFAWPDADQAGRKYAADVGRASAGLAADVRTVVLPEGLPDGWDLADPLPDGWTVETVHSLIAAARRTDESVSDSSTEVSRHTEVIGSRDRRTALKEKAACELRLNNLTDSGAAERFADCAEGRLRWSEAGHWLAWDGRRWRPRATEAQAQRVAKEVIAQLYEEAARTDHERRRKSLVGFALDCERESRRRAMIRLARSEPGVEIAVADLDRDPWLLNVLNGTIDLRTGELRPHSAEDGITKLCRCRFDPDARAPRFERFLREVFGGDQTIVDYLQRLGGYSLTGITDEHVIAFCWGGGRNGKTTLFEILRTILGDYARAGSMDLIVARRTSSLDNLTATNLADLQGMRLVTVEELPQSARLDEGLVKNATGGGVINACRKYQNPITFSPTHKLLVATNHRPVISGTDEGIWRRVHLLPFECEFLLSHEAKELGLDPLRLPQGKYVADPRLKDALVRGEASGILAWLVRGARSWRERGTDPPEIVRAAVRSYRRDEDLLGRFLEECCTIAPHRSSIQVRSTELREALGRYMLEAGSRRTPSNNELAERLKRVGCEECRIGHAGHRGWRGIGLLSERDDERTNGSAALSKRADTADSADVRPETLASRASHGDLSGPPSAPSAPSATCVDVGPSGSDGFVEGIL